MHTGTAKDLNKCTLPTPLKWIGASICRACLNIIQNVWNIHDTIVPVSQDRICRYFLRGLSLSTTYVAIEESKHCNVGIGDLKGKSEHSEYHV